MGLFLNILQRGAVFSRKPHAWRHHHWRFRRGGDTWRWCRHSHQRLAFVPTWHWSRKQQMATWAWRQSNWRVEGPRVQQRSSECSAGCSSVARTCHWRLRVARGRRHHELRVALKKIAFICSSPPLYCSSLSSAFYFHLGYSESLLPCFLCFFRSCCL